MRRTDPKVPNTKPKRGKAKRRSLRRAVYAGSFDPITKGHVWVIEQGAGLFDELIVAVGDNPDKASTFTVEERMGFLGEVTASLENVRIETFSHRFLIHFAQDMGAAYILRGLRNPMDFESEQVMRIINGDLDPTINTVFVMPPRRFAELSSSFVKGLVGPAGWEDVVRPYVPGVVFRALKKKRR